MSQNGSNLEGRPSVIPYLCVEGVDDLIAMLVNVFDARLIGKLRRPDGGVMHAEVQIGNSVVMMGEPMGQFDPAPAWVFVTVDDCDAVYAKALAAGCTVEMEMMELPHAGERYGGVLDAHGNTWWIATQTEKVSWDEQQRRIDALVEQGLGD